MPAAAWVVVAGVLKFFALATYMAGIHETDWHFLGHLEKSTIEEQKVPNKKPVVSYRT